MKTFNAKDFPLFYAPASEFVNVSPFKPVGFEPCLVNRQKKIHAFYITGNYGRDFDFNRPTFLASHIEPAIQYNPTLNISILALMVI